MPTEISLQEHSDGSTYVGRLQAHGPDLATWLSSSALESSPLQNLVVPEGRSTSGWVPHASRSVPEVSVSSRVPGRRAFIICYAAETMLDCKFETSQTLGRVLESLSPTAAPLEMQKSCPLTLCGLSFSSPSLL